MTEEQDRNSAALADRLRPSRNDGVTIAEATCPVCGCAFRPSGRRRFCSDACRQMAWRHRHSMPAAVQSIPEAPPRPGTTIYECPSCGSRYLGEQRCADCRLFCRRVGPGGRCPHCDEVVAVGDLLGEEVG
jgi:hypothetical protein